MSYTKLANSSLTSTIWMEDDQTRIVWLALMAMADKKPHGAGKAANPRPIAPNSASPPITPATPPGRSERKNAGGHRAGGPFHGM